MGQHRVLLIEDDPDYAQLVNAVLAANGDTFVVQTTATLREGLAAATHFRPDIILLDLDLPDSSGYETFLRVRALAFAPIVVVTGTDDEAMALRAAENGAHDFLVKGLQQPKVIARCVKMVLRRQAPKAAALTCPELYYG